MFTENLDRGEENEGEYREEIEYSINDEDFNGDLSKGISFGVAYEMQ